MNCPVRFCMYLVVEKNIKIRKEEEEKRRNGIVSFVLLCTHIIQGRPHTGAHPRYDTYIMNACTKRKKIRNKEYKEI